MNQDQEYGKDALFLGGGVLTKSISTFIINAIIYLEDIYIYISLKLHFFAALLLTLYS